MIPETIYRTEPEGYHYETREDAVAQSVDDRAVELFNLLKSQGKDYSKSGGELIGLKLEIREATKQLFRAFDGKLVTEYKLKK